MSKRGARMLWERRLENAETGEPEDRPLNV